MSVVSAGQKAGSSAKITVNDAAVEMEMNKNKHYRGLHIVILNPADYKAVVAKVFDTYESSEELEAFISNDFPGIPAGHVLVAACQDECVKAMTEPVK